MRRNSGTASVEMRLAKRLCFLLISTPISVAPGYELGNNYSIFAPAGTPKPVLTVLNREVSRIVNVGEVKEKFAADGAEPAPPVGVDEFRRAYHAEVSKWEKFVRTTKVEL